MLESSIVTCPDSFWDKKNFWYAVYHTIFYLDYYSSENPNQFLPPEPFTLSEFDPSGILPERIYSKEELLEYLEYSRRKSFFLISGLTEKTSQKRFINDYRNYSIFEMILYNMRHVQHHVGQLNLLLRQNVDDAGKWVSQTQKKILKFILNKTSAKSMTLRMFYL